VFRDEPVHTFARTNVRQPYRHFGIKPADRLMHVYVIGRSGTGKTTLLERMIEGDLRHGAGGALIDPHGDLAERVVARAERLGRTDLIYLDMPDPDLPFGYNPLTYIAPEYRPLLASGMLEVMQMLWPSAWGVRMEYILRNALLALLDQPSATLADVPRLLREKAFRRQVAENVSHEPVREFWKTDYEKFVGRFQAEAIAAIMNKVGALLADPRLHRFLTREDNRLRFRRIMDEGQFLVVNLAKGALGADSANLMGGLLVTALSLAALSRIDLPAEQRRPFYLYVDEFQSFTTLSFAIMTAELRKFGVGLVLAHQYLGQLSEQVRDAVLGNAGTLIAFRLGPFDARFVAREFAPLAAERDLLNLPNHEVYVKLMVDGEPLRPFSARTLVPDA